MKSGIRPAGIPAVAYDGPGPPPSTTDAEDGALADPLAAAWAAGHEQVVLCHDRPSGLRAIIAVYSTALGPALGGTRFHPYPTTGAALADVLALAKAMAYKNALAGLDHGGGKAVIIGDPRTAKTEALLRAYGRFVESLGGRYITACDVGTYVGDMDVVARESRHVTGRSEASGGAGDSSVLTAYGVFQGMRAAAQVRWGQPTLSGRLVGVSGVGKVGRNLVPLLLDDGARVIVADVDAAAVAGLRERHPGVAAAPDTDALLAEGLDAFSPCAMGGVLTAEVAGTTSVPIICGGANNQLATPEVAQLLADRGVLYCPDFCVNAGGVIQVADEVHGFSFERARARTSRIFDTTLGVLTEAERSGVTPVTAAEAMAERRMADIGALGRIHLR
jgi:valine dehydrogenase (NAD+)